MKIIIEEEVPIVFTAAGNPKLWTSYLKDNNCTVAHVVSSVKFALKAEDVESSKQGIKFIRASWLSYGFRAIKF